MLILSRKIGESLIINDEIKIIVVNATERQVTLGIEAPKEVPIHREEVYHEIKNTT